MLVTKKAPDFTATAVLANNQIVEDFNLYKNIGVKGAVLFFYPKNFTFVCPSEIIAFDKKYQDFKQKGIEIIAVCGDNEFAHLAWKNIPVNEGGIGQVQFPIVADLTRGIARAFDVLFNEAVALRASFLLDKDGTIRHATINDLSLGRNIDEMMRMVDAMLFVNEYGESCPAGWNKGDKGIKTKQNFK